MQWMPAQLVGSELPEKEMQCRLSGHGIDGTIVVGV